MLAASSTAAATATNSAGQRQQHVGEADPFVLYARSLHDYTLRLWTESRRIAEEKARLKAAAGRGGPIAQQNSAKSSDGAPARS